MSRARFRRVFGAEPITQPPSPPFSGNTFFMAPALSGGNDANNGTQNFPVFTFGRAAQLMAPGDRCFLRGGTYLLNTYISGFTGGTSWSASKLFQTYVGESATIKPAGNIGANMMYFTGANTKYIEFSGYDSNDGVTVRNLFWDYSNAPSNAANVLKITYDNDPNLNAAHHIRLRNCEITNSNKDGQGLQMGSGCIGSELIRSRLHHCGLPGNRLVHGAYWAGADGVVEYCEFDNNSGAGMQFWHDGVPDVDDCVVRYSMFHHNGTQGLIIGEGTASMAHNCIAYSNAEVGFQGWTGGTNSKWYFCTSVSNGSYGFQLHNHTSPTIQNCVAQSNGTSPYNNDGTSTGITQDHNHFSGVDPKFVNPGANNYHLQSDSPLRDQAVSIGGITVDYDGVSMDASPDIGAFQFV